jgi:hypothetical protein
MTEWAIYSAGPSLVKTMRGGYAGGIAVNAAAKVIPREYYDYLSAGDPEIYSRIPAPNFGWLILGGFDKQVEAMGPPWTDLLHWVWADIGCAKGCSFSIVAAMHLAAHLGADTVHLFGHDCTADVDCAGWPPEDRTSYRTAERWRREAYEMQDAAQKLRLHVITHKDLTA